MDTAYLSDCYNCSAAAPVRTNQSGTAIVIELDRFEIASPAAPSAAC